MGKKSKRRSAKEDIPQTREDNKEEMGKVSNGAKERKIKAVR